ncbi:MAG: ABC transporter permease subunit [Gammaproteobacteria bacterium]
MNSADLQENPARERLRLLKDRSFGAVMGVGGIAVILAIALIFIYLLYTVLPLFGSARVTAAADFSSPTSAPPRMVALDEYAEIGLIVGADGSYRFVSTASGDNLLSGRLVDDAARVSAVAAGAPAQRTLAAATQDGMVVIARADYTVSYPDDRRSITPKMSFPYGTAPLDVSVDGAAIEQFTAQANDDEASIAAITTGGRLVLLNVARQTSFLDDEVTLETTRADIASDVKNIDRIAMDIDQRELYTVSTQNVLSYYDISDKSNPVLVDRASLVADGARVTAFEFLSGGISVIVGDDRGRLTQWFPVRDRNNRYTLARVRELEAMPAAISHIGSEHNRKGFAAFDVAGNLGIYYATSDRQLAVAPTGSETIVTAAFAPRADAVLAADASGRLRMFEVRNPHPEVSWRALWGKVWYENRQEPEYIWQSSSASAEFEPKFSLTPLTFGTFKASFYSMLFAMPIAVFGAIYTAYFMSAPMRAIVKPSIEVMAALPTVILGFLAGLWLAPLIERELIGIFLTLIMLPAMILAAAFVWFRLPVHWRRSIPDGWEALLLIPVLCLSVWMSIVLGERIEAVWFGGNVTHWLHATYDISYDQRNSLVVGIAIGFAVIPTIFTISEDAVYSVPRSLTMGSLALGATPWQTALKVVLLTASPGIFSALMIGMGRAVGETMIVLMATGNTPIMDLNIFEGFRALSANIAVEMPESEVHSTHYRILFLAALVLFLVTFAVNTLAEIVRQRLRRKYASL